MKKVALALLIPAAAMILAACGIATMPSHDDWYTKHYYIMQDFERDTYKKLSAAARLDFQKLFWEARDPKSKKIFDERLDFVMKTYKRDNARQPWNCDRARIYLLNGSPNDVESAQNANWTMQTQPGGGGVASLDDRTNEDISGNTQEVWTYRWEIYIVNYVFTFRPPNEWRFTGGGGRYLGALEIWSKENTYGILNRGEYDLKIEELKSLK
jgi:GWxTD domain-containing protein